MENGVTTFPTHDAMRPGDLARLVEERGHRYLFFSEHTHIPASRITPFPGGEPLERKYWNTYDVFVALTAAAMATTSLRVGSGICLIAQRDPIVTAKEIASIDHMSGGRVEVGVGAGWNREEMENHGTDPRTRFSRMAESVEAMKAIWTQDEATYDGRTSPSTASGRGRSPRSVRTRRCSSAASVRRCSTASWRSATDGSRSRTTGCSIRSPSCAAARRSRAAR